MLWTQEWPVVYGALSYNWAIGPRATPTVDGDRVYVLGATGVLVCLDVATGRIIWQKDYVKDYGTELPTWGMTGAPLVDGDRLICLVGGEPDAKVVAFDKMTGKEIWRALPSKSEPGYAQPIIIKAGGTRQLIIWHPEALASLDPVTGKVYWELADGGRLRHDARDAGSERSTGAAVRDVVLQRLDDGRARTRRSRRPACSGRATSDSEIQTDGLHSTINTPIVQGDHIYGICSYGQFRCLKAATGERVWETQAITKERARWASGLMVRHGDRVFINNDRGDLIIGALTPKGFHEISRTLLIKPTSPPGNRRELADVNWSHPAYANRHIYARNDEEIIAASLAVDGR